MENYSVPIYAAAWIPAMDTVASNSEINSIPEANQVDEKPCTSMGQYYFVLAGGGGCGRSGIKNAIMVTGFDFATRSLSSQPIAMLELDSDLPYRMAVHPIGKSLICSFPKDCRIFEFERTEGTEIFKLLPASQEIHDLKDVGQQLALTFSSDGLLIAAGGEDGHVRVLRWPSLQIVFNRFESVPVKELCFSPTGKYLVSLSSTFFKAWDVNNARAEATTTAEKDTVFISCRFSPGIVKNELLYVAAIEGNGGCIMKWETSSWKKLSSKCKFRQAITSFDISPSGVFLAIGTVEGDVLLINSATLQVQMTVKKAHIGFVTALAFSSDSRVLLSTSIDSRARVTCVENKAHARLRLWVSFIIVFLATIAYFLKSQRHHLF